MVCSAEGDILDAEALGSGSILWRRVGVFSHSQQKIEGNADKVTKGTVFGVRACKTLKHIVVGHCDRNRQFGFGRWVRTTIAFYLLLESWPVGGSCLLLVRGGGFKVQLEGLGNGCHRLLNSLSANLIFSSCISVAYPMGKGLDKSKLFWLWETGKEWIGEAKVGDKGGPVSPEFLSRVVSLSHDPMGCCS